MKKTIHKYLIIGFFVGFLIACTTLGIKSFDNANMYGGPANPSVTCSSDGKYVYIVDLNNLYKSEDFGETWKKINVPEEATQLE